MAATYQEWCRHYGYDPESKKARADYQRYLDELAVLERLAGRAA